MSPRRLAWIALTAIVPAACALGPAEPPGCEADADCDDGFTCRAGACFRTTTLRPPPAEEDAGDGGG